ncbi:MAG: class I SAM-dependent methyltransferase [Tepidisphaeraceae bacterium]
MDRKAHWETVYETKPQSDVSWYQAEPTLSLELIRRVCPVDGRIIDIGGGASMLVDRLLALHFSSPAVLDISAAAIARGKARLGEKAQQANWIVADVTQARNIGQFDIWHDRAVFHFLTLLDDRRSYVDLASRTLRSGGHLILATFAPDGPTRCSGLEVCRYDAAAALLELGKEFSLVHEERESHVTPAGKRQSFFYGVFRRR